MNLDREEQRVDNLFINGSLKKLIGLDLSGFYQTVDNKTIQDLCYNHLSSNSLTDEHLQYVRPYFSTNPTFKTHLKPTSYLDEAGC